ncbi:MAG: hypothetical protein P8Y61_08620 [Gammaproteobacteria bacterium]
MGTKYYTRFLLQTVDETEVDEYSGVVEWPTMPEKHSFFGVATPGDCPSVQAQANVV